MTDFVKAAKITLLLERKCYEIVMWFAEITVNVSGQFMRTGEMSVTLRKTQCL